MHKVAGFDILVNDVWRTFRATEDDAYDAAIVLKQRSPQQDVKIRNSITNQTRAIPADGSDPRKAPTLLLRQ